MRAQYWMRAHARAEILGDTGQSCVVDRLLEGVDIVLQEKDMFV